MRHILALCVLLFVVSVAVGEQYPLNQGPYAGARASVFDNELDNFAPPPPPSFYPAPRFPPNYRRYSPEAEMHRQQDAEPFPRFAEVDQGAEMGAEAGPKEATLSAPIKTNVDVKLIPPAVDTDIAPMVVNLPDIPKKGASESYLLPSIRLKAGAVPVPSSKAGTNSPGDLPACCDGCPVPCAVPMQDDPVATVDMRIQRKKSQVDSHDRWLNDALRVLEKLQRDIRKVNDSRNDIAEELVLLRKDRTSIILREGRNKLEKQLDEAKAALDHLEKQTAGLEETAGSLVQTKEAYLSKIRSLGSQIQQTSHQLQGADPPKF